MQIIIPMSGFGERFRCAGYQLPKPLIDIDGKPIIGHVIDMFPGESDFLFVCNRDHLAEPSYRMEETLRRLCPSGRILGIAPHKLGPVHAVLQASGLIDPERPAVVNYADFTCYWDWHHFRRFVTDARCDGAITAYRGFHPHSLGTTNYAYMRERDGWVLDIQEKRPYTDNRMQEYASSGTYYFASGRLLMESFEEMRAANLNVGGEYYVSLAYKPMLARNCSIAVYELQHFMQWGTPEDVVEYSYWSRAFRQLVDAAPLRRAGKGTVIVPMAGLGKRFTDEGYEVTKPLIPVSGAAMVVQATRDLPPARHYVFVLRADMPGYPDIARHLKEIYPDCIIATVDRLTEGQACTALIGLDAVEDRLGEVPGPVTFGACDNGALYNAATYEALMSDSGVDVLVWGIRGYPNAARHPRLYGWIDTDGTAIRSISVKQPLADPLHDPVILGTFTFQRAADFRKAVERLIARDGRINGEFYIDTCINDAVALGLNCLLFNVKSYLCWGTPNDLHTFEYWQSCFHKWPGHPYSLRCDVRVPRAEIARLEERYQSVFPAMPSKRQ